MKTNKGMAVTLVSVMVAGLIAGCSTQSTTEVKSASPTPPASVKQADPATIRLFTENQAGWPVKQDWPVWSWVKEKTNITIKPEPATGPESMALTIASGDMPDVYSLYPFDVSKYGAQGAFIDMGKHLDKMPNLKAFLAEKPEVLNRIKSLTGGELLYIPNDGAGASNQLVWFNREDVFTKHNLTQPKTWDELYETAKKLKQLYPDSYPLVFRHGLGTLNTFAPSFGIYPQFYEDLNAKKIKYGPQEPAFKEMITYLNKLYKEALFQPDWLSMDYKAWTQAITTNKSFITVQYIGQIEIMNNELKDKGRLQYMAPPVGSGSKAYLPRAFEVVGNAISAKTKNLDAALRYVDFLYSKEGRDILSWGKEGQTYTVENGKRKFKPEYKQPNDIRKDLGIMTAGAYGWLNYDSILSLIAENERTAYVEAPKISFPTSEALPYLTASEMETVTLTSDPLVKYYETSVIKFIIGETPMTQWDSFVSELNKQGATKILDIYQKALERQKAK